MGNSFIENTLFMWIYYVYIRSHLHRKDEMQNYSHVPKIKNSLLSKLEHSKWCQILHLVVQEILFLFPTLWLLSLYVRVYFLGHYLLSESPSCFSLNRNQVVQCKEIWSKLFNRQCKALVFIWGKWFACSRTLHVISW